MEFVAIAAPPLDIAVDGPGVTGLNFLNGVGYDYFCPGDNVLLKKIWVNIPYGFGQGQGRMTMALAYRTPLDDLLPIPVFSISVGSVSALAIPGAACCVEFPGDGVLIPALTAENGDADQPGFAIALTAFNLNVSALGVPDLLVDEVIKVQVHFLVSHTRNMRVLV